MVRKTIVAIFLLSLVASLYCENSCADDLDVDPESKRNSGLMAEYAKRAASYSMKLLDPETDLFLQPQPVFNWINAARQGEPQVHQGSVFVWTHKGRAEAIGTIFSVIKGDNDPRMYHELHSLSTQRLGAKLEAMTVWTPSQAGVDPHPFARAPKLSPTANGRLVQMRQLARRFSGYSLNKDDTRWELELLPQPLHRSTEKHPDVLDGALFALKSTAGTDPEILLVIEARKDSGEWKWHYSICRFTDLRTWISLGDEVVWSLEAGGFSTAAGTNDIYRTITDRNFSLSGE